MKKLFGVLVLFSFLISCTKKQTDKQCPYNDSQTVAPDNEVQKVKAYLDSNNITATKHASGFYYNITSQGSGASVVNLCSVVSVKYIGKFTNGTTFDSTANNTVASLELGRLIIGWQKGIPLLNKGGKITLYIPPSLGYGPQDVKDQQGKVVVPGNSILIFDIELADIT